MSDDRTTAERATSFGAVADDYETFRAGPPSDAVEWLLPHPVGRVVDVGAGTGALTRLLVSHATEVIAVDPDPDMRRTLNHLLPQVLVREGRGEDLPVDAGSVDALIASSSWHWVDPAAGTKEAARVLRPGGLLAALWTGPDPDGAFMAQARDALASRRTDRVLEGTVSGGYNPNPSLEVPVAAPFGEVEQRTFNWTMALTADELIGLLGTLSWVIVLEDARRREVLDTARNLLEHALGIHGDITADVDYACIAYRCRRA